MNRHDAVKLAQVFASSQVAISDIAETHPGLISEMRRLDPVRTAVYFGALLAVPELQANCYRLETLVHLSLLYCHGRNAPTSAFVRRAFEQLGKGPCGRIEDPAEDVFISLVSTPEGNFRIFEGIREGTGFHLQRILNVVESMPDVPPFDHIRTGVGCLLKLSEKLAERIGLQANLLGVEVPVDSIPDGVCDRLWRTRKALCFSERDFTELNITRRFITPFAFNAAEKIPMNEQSLGHTALERRPIIFEGKSAYVLLPTAIESAITRFVVEAVTSTRTINAFESKLAHDYSELLACTPILGGSSNARIPMQKCEAGHIGTAITEVDTGRFLHLVVWVDGLAGFNEDGLNGTNPNYPAVSSAIREHLKQASAYACGQPNFRDGITVLVTCGFGRGSIVEIEGPIPKHWRVEHLPAHDLVTLSWDNNFSPLSLWRLLDSQEAVEKYGVELFNVNGLLNLAAWVKELGGHVVPHGELPDGVRSSEARGIVVVRQNGLRRLRHEMSLKSDPRRALDSTGNWVKVRKFNDSEFDEDTGAPLYVSEDELREGKLRAVYVARDRAWWVELISPDGADRRSAFEHWQMLCCWIRRAAPVLEEAYRSLPRGPLNFEFRFSKIVGITEGRVTAANAEQLRSDIVIRSEVGSQLVKIEVGEVFDDALAQPENVAERAIVEALVTAAATVGGEIADTHKLAEIVKVICPSQYARWRHRIHARTFRDFVTNAPRALLIDSMDDAFCRIGLGLKARPQGTGEIMGSDDCKRCLNESVRQLLDQLCESLKLFERCSFVTAVLQTHEAAAISREKWKRTARANLALHDDKRGAIRTILDHIGRLNACSLASRILIEAAICECPVGKGGPPGALDLSRLMAQVMLAHHLGGWSDAIHWGAMEPRIRITPLGDILMNYEFMETIFEPFGQTGGESDIKRAVRAYKALYEPAEGVRSVAELLEPQFLEAWRAEYGVSIDDIRRFIDLVEDEALRPPRLFYELRRSEVIRMLSEGVHISSDEATETIAAITLRPRSEWRSAEPGTSNKDWYPSRFRRRLSLMRRPIIQLDDQPDPSMIVAPGIVGDSLHAMMRAFHGGEIPQSQVRSDAMRKWIGQTNNVQRTEFNLTVANRMRELGWQVQREVKLTKILRQSLDRDYGDVDVLAWRPESRRVLAIECKDLQFHKTIGEVAEQLSDFRGELRQDGKPDHLKRHLDRLDVLTKFKSTVARTLKMECPIEIEGHLVFKNFVPMQFAWDHMKCRIRLLLFDELQTIT
jgi:hypothetical protein